MNTDDIRLVGGPDQIEELTTSAGAGASVAAGPPGAVVDGLVESDLTARELESVRQRVADGAAVVLAADVDDETANVLAQHLRDHQAENVIIHGSRGETAR
ncbi:MAG: hypothetical protein JOZ81_08995 [Chloroflexi bacterium]|nr:hypothetical protein [Chloroflexota bacterium]